MAINEDRTEETNDALIMAGFPIIQFEPPAQQIIKTDRGFRTVTTLGWIKLALQFRNILADLKGAKLAVYIAICLHVNESGKAWPSITTLCAETGYERASVIKAVKEIKEMGIMGVFKDRGKSNKYTPAHAAYGENTPKPTSSENNTSTSSEKRTTPVAKSEPEVEPISRTKEEETTISRKRERTPLELELSELQSLFSELTGIPEPSPKDRSAPVRWFQPIRKIQTVCNGQSAECIKRAVSKMRNDGLTISAPQSIEKNSIAAYGEINKGYSQPNATYQQNHSGYKVVRGNEIGGDARDDAERLSH